MSKLSAIVFWIGFLCVFGVVGPNAHAQGPPSGQAPTGAGSPGDSGAAAGPTAPGKLSEAEKVTRLQATIEADQERLGELEAKLAEHEEEFEKAGEEFRAVDEQLNEGRRAVDALRLEGKAEAADAFAESLADVEKKWKLSRERFDVAIQFRRTVQEQIVALKQKIEADRAALKKLIEPEVVEPPAPPAGAERPPTGETPPASAPAAPQREPLPGQAAKPESAPTSAEGGGEAVEEKTSPPPEHVAKAREEAASKEFSAAEARRQVEDIEDRLQRLQRNAELERQARDVAAKQAANAEATLQMLGDELEKKMAENAPPGELEQLRAKMEEAQNRLREARVELDRRSTKLDELQTQRSELLQERIAAMNEAAKKQQQAEAAREKLESLESPLAIPNVLAWLREHGPVIGAIVLGVLVGMLLCRLAIRRLVRVMAVAGGRGNADDRQRRAEILGKSLSKIATVVLVVAGVLLILHEIDVPVAPLWTMVSAIFAMVAIGFVAVWSVLSNTLCSLMLLIFQPFKVGSSVELLGTAVRGKVVNFNLVYTTLKTDNGDAIEVPNNTFFQQAIRHREKGECIELDQQLTDVGDAE